MVKSKAAVVPPVASHQSTVRCRWPSWLYDSTPSAAAGGVWKREDGGQLAGRYCAGAAAPAACVACSRTKEEISTRTRVAARVPVLSKGHEGHGGIHVLAHPPPLVAGAGLGRQVATSFEGGGVLSEGRGQAEATRSGAATKVRPAWQRTRNMAVTQAPRHSSHPLT